MQSHRASEIIDHVARSIVGDKINALEDAAKAGFIGVVDEVFADGVTCVGADWVTNEWVGHQVYWPDDYGDMHPGLITSNTTNRLYFTWEDEQLECEGWPIAVTLATFIEPIYLSYAYEPTFNNRAVRLNGTGAAIQRILTCNQVAIIASISSDCGKVDVYIDDVLTATVDLYSAVGMGMVRVWELAFETLTERTIKVVRRSDKNAASSGYRCDINGLDVNGVVSVSSLSIATRAVVNNITTNANGYGFGNISQPDGYYIIGILGWNSTGKNSPTVATPKVFIYPFAGYFRVDIDDGQPNTTFGITTYLLIAKSDPWGDV
jgi:hypothetical protein